MQSTFLTLKPRLSTEPGLKYSDFISNSCLSRKRLRRDLGENRTYMSTQYTLRDLQGLHQRIITLHVIGKFWPSSSCSVNLEYIFITTINLGLLLTKRRYSTHFRKRTSMDCCQGGCISYRSTTLLWNTEKDLITALPTSCRERRTKVLLVIIPMK